MPFKETHWLRQSVYLLQFHSSRDTPCGASHRYADDAASVGKLVQFVFYETEMRQKDEDNRNERERIREEERREQERKREEERREWE